MKNWKTTLFGGVAALPQVVKLLWPECPPAVLDLITSACVVAAFYFAKDKNVTGAA